MLESASLVQAQSSLRCHAPMPEPSGRITELLVRWRAGDGDALERLIPLVYAELHRLARRYLKSERPGHTLQSTDLVHEAYLRLADQNRVEWRNRAHFYGIAAMLIRNILVDHARTHRAAKRGGGDYRVSLAAVDMAVGGDIDLVALDDALLKLVRIDAQQSRIVELRFFGGLTIEETAQVLNVSESTVKRQWILAKTWIFRELSS